MSDAALVELCARCLADAASDDGPDDDLTFSATALARDLLDTLGSGAAALLAAASCEAGAYLDASELDARGFARALRRLAGLRAGVATRLAAAAA